MYIIYLTEDTSSILFRLAKNLTYAVLVFDKKFVWQFKPPQLTIFQHSWVENIDSYLNSSRKQINKAANTAAAAKY